MKKYTIYYDESNNHRKLSVDGNKLNIDNNPQNKASINFLIAGVAHEKNHIIDTLDWKETLRLSGNHNDVKFKQIAQGNFIECLKSPSLTKFLQWLDDKELYIHYFDINLLYWSFVDIIDDLYLYVTNARKFDINFLKPRFPNKDTGELIRFYLDFMKNALYEIIQIDKAAFFSLAYKYDYPNIKNNLESNFIQDIKELVQSYIKDEHAIKKYSLSNSKIIQVKELIELLEIGSDIDELTLVYEPNSNLLINTFSHFYKFCGNMFPNCLHIFDEETEIQDHIENIEIHFEKSECNDFIQMSDIVSGLMGKYFSYLNENSYQNIINAKKNFNKYQIETLNLLKKLVLKSDVENQLFLYYTAPKSELVKHQLMLFDLIYDETDLLYIDFFDKK